jgi:hypothetical protein
MPFFQNPFASDFEGYWVLADRQASLTFRCPRNAGRGAENATAWTQGPYNLSGTDADGNDTNVLNLFFSTNMGDYKNWTAVSVTLTGANQGAVLPSEIVGCLNGNTLFSDWFTASLQTFQKNPTGFISNDRIVITQKKPQVSMRFYVAIGQAESLIQFNKLAGVAPLPTYFARHTIANRYEFPDSQNALIQLSTTGTQAAVINDALNPRGNSLGFSSSAVPADYALLAGRSGLFLFTNNTLDGSGRVTSSILYQAGAVVGDTGKKTEYTYSGSNTTPSTIAEIPYVLASGDIITPS